MGDRGAAAIAAALLLAAGAPGSARAAILNFLSACPPSELHTLLELFLEPLSAAFLQKPGGEEAGQERKATEEEGQGAAGGRPSHACHTLCVCLFDSAFDD